MNGIPCNYQNLVDVHRVNKLFSTFLENSPHEISNTFTSAHLIWFLFFFCEWQQQRKKTTWLFQLQVTEIELQKCVSNATKVAMLIQRTWWFSSLNRTRCKTHSMDSNFQSFHMPNGINTRRHRKKILVTNITRWPHNRKCDEQLFCVLPSWTNELFLFRETVYSSCISTFALALVCPATV